VRELSEQRSCLVVVAAVGDEIREQIERGTCRGGIIREMIHDVAQGRPRRVGCPRCKKNARTLVCGLSGERAVDHPELCERVARAIEPCKRLSKRNPVARSQKRRLREGPLERRDGSRRWSIDRRAARYDQLLGWRETREALVQNLDRALRVG
jgi:hypothetical protein